jgi:hypothetical protein
MTHIERPACSDEGRVVRSALECNCRHAVTRGGVATVRNPSGRTALRPDGFIYEPIPPESF